MPIVKKPFETPAEDAQDTSPESVQEDAQDMTETPQEQAGDTGPESAQEDASEGGDEDSPNVTPQEQAMYDATVTAAMRLIFGQDLLPIIVQKLQSGKDNLSQAVGHTAAMIMLSVRSSIIKQGKQLPDDIAYAAGQEVIGDLCDVAVGAKIIDQSKVETIANAALFEAMRVWGQQMAANGDITPEVSGRAKQDLNEAGVQQQAPAGPAAPAPKGIVNTGVGA